MQIGLVESDSVLVDQEEHDFVQGWSSGNDFA